MAGEVCDLDLYVSYSLKNKDPLLHMDPGVDGPLREREREREEEWSMFEKEPHVEVSEHKVTRVKGSNTYRYQRGTVMPFHKSLCSFCLY